MKKHVPPFGDIHRNYADSLERVILAMGKVQTTCEALLSTGAIVAGSDKLRAALAEYEAAWYGEK